MACHDCGIDTSNATGIGHYYMAHDEIWQQAKRGNRLRFLCLDCLEGRLRRPLRSTDFMFTPSEIEQRLVTGKEHTVLPERERQRWLDYWRAVPRHTAPIATHHPRRPVAERHGMAGSGGCGTLRQAGTRQGGHTMVGPDPGWEPAVQSNGQEEMAHRLRYQGPAAAAEFGARFERSANEWLAHSGFDPAFVFHAIPLPALS